MTGDDRPIDLSIGDPGYEPPREAQAVAVQAIARGLGGYAPMGGLRRLRAALAEHLSEREGVPATPQQVVVSTGASLGIFATMAAVCRPGDTVLIPDPGFPLYRQAAMTLGLHVTGYPLGDPDSGHAPDWDVLATLVPQARLLIWNFPANPLGVIAEPGWIDRLGSLMRSSPELYVISDEVYRDLCLDGQHVSPVVHTPELADRIITAFSFSKSYGMAAWRVGYLHATANLAERIAQAHWRATMSTPTMAQLGALACLRVSGDYLDARRTFLRDNRDLTLARLRGCGLPCAEPPAGFFTWIDTTVTGLDGTTFVQHCAKQTGVLLSPGADFGASGTKRVRLNFAVSTDRLVTALDRMKGWIETTDLVPGGAT